MYSNHLFSIKSGSFSGYDIIKWKLYTIRKSYVNSPKKLFESYRRAVVRSKGGTALRTVGVFISIHWLCGKLMGVCGLTPRMPVNYLGEADIYIMLNTFKFHFNRLFCVFLLHIFVVQQVSRVCRKGCARIVEIITFMIGWS